MAAPDREHGGHNDRDEDEREAADGGLRRAIQGGEAHGGSDRGEGSRYGDFKDVPVIECT